jgi:hypothetical protein
MTKIGTRVGAISHGDGETIYIFGFGTYEGEEIPTSAAGWMAEALCEYGQTNPKIVLDNGKVVWGCECWWSSEEEVRKQLADRTVVEVDVDESRAEYARQKQENPNDQN